MFAEAKTSAGAPSRICAANVLEPANENLARLRDAAKIDASIRNARSRFAIGKHHSAIQLLEGLDPGAHPTVAAALRELRTALQAIEERRRQAEADAKRPKIVDDDATHVIVMPEILAKMPADGAAPVAVATDLRTGSPVADPAPATVSASSEAESQRRLMVFGGVLLLLVIIAAIILRFAP